MRDVSERNKNLESIIYSTLALVLLYQLVTYFPITDYKLINFLLIIIFRSFYFGIYLFFGFFSGIYNIFI